MGLTDAQSSEHRAQGTGHRTQGTGFGINSES